MDIPSLGAGIVGLSFLGDLLIAAAQEINTNKLMTEQSVLTIMN